MSEQLNLNDSGLKKSLDCLNSVLIGGENLEAWAIQRRLFALAHRRILTAATSGRFIVLKRNIIGGFNIIDKRWQDLKDVKIQVGIFGADLTVSFSGASDLAVTGDMENTVSFKGLNKEQAQKVYRLCQAHEQSWREKRRIRELEEMRAKAGGVQISGTGASPNTDLSGTQSNDEVTRLQKARQMLDAKLISDAEYESVKAKIISGI
ncbi:MAG: hypothetical protein WCV67_21190 [Victivallaceae bacterium]